MHSQSARQTCPAILVAAPASGQGKTTVTSALARLHARQGRRVRVFKCGPDFLDPHWHTLASGAPVYQLDLWMTGEADCRARLSAAAADADLIIVEGVMGLFDGTPSAADLARRFGLHVLAVVDASAMAGTFGALAFGLQHCQSGLPWAGVLANRVAGTGHSDMLRDSLNQPQDWLGALMHNPALVLPERHLGLTVASEVPDALMRLDAAADALADTPLGRMTLEDLQCWNTEFQPAENCAKQATTRLLQGKVIAVARDAAFCFLYAANLDCLQAMGADLRFFSPLENEAVPACDAVWLPGGYPELHRQNCCEHINPGRPGATHRRRSASLGRVRRNDGFTGHAGHCGRQEPRAVGLAVRRGQHAKTVGGPGSTTVDTEIRHTARPYLSLFHHGHHHASRHTDR